MSRPLPQRKLLILIISLLVLGIFFRFVNLDRKVYWHDEVYTSMRSSGYTGKEVGEQVFNGNVISIADLQKYQRLSPEKNLNDTIDALIKHPEHPPLYYLMVRFWMQFFGSSVTVTRSLSAALSLLVFPSIYWLSLELFESSLVGWVAVAIFTVSPFHVLYAQEAREYSLWTVTILLSSAALLRAIRQTKNQDTKLPILSWSMYAVSLVLSFYTFLFSAFVAIGHGVYVFATEGYRITRTFTAYLLASLVGVIAFIPWFLVIIVNFTRVKQQTHWTTIKTPILFLFKIWGLHLSCIFLDFGLDIEHPFTYLVPPLLLFLVGYSIYFLYRNTTQQVWLFILALIGITPLFLIAPDLIFGGIRSAESRYFVPVYIGIQLAVAYLFATKISAVNILRQQVWRGIMLVLISGAVISCTVSSQSETWWNKKVSYHNHYIAKIINQANSPLLVSETSDFKAGNIISLSYLLEPKVKFQSITDPKVQKIADGFSDIFLHYPREDFQRILEQQHNAKVEMVKNPHNAPLWKLIR
ncbi:hypothetical protein BC008_33085 [Mastigocoleus testarum BC008]|uniref:Uncharacterized protein n=1 Tax=Mastigocoleus testarum BC008 TaxID=371196 RepID=A0A0V7ZV53_9CYAN|nr:hypothetical protein BC008_32040 [Mastigocoleus testarum BC008]KST68426.1 hypothetical protein BC008_33085 [Mastigocoleus testarum BC008]